MAQFRDGRNRALTPGYNSSHPAFAGLQQTIVH